MNKNLKQNKAVWKHTQQIAEEFNFKPAEKHNISDFANKEFRDSRDFSEDSEKRVMVFHKNFLEVAKATTNRGYKSLVVLNSGITEPFTSLDSGASGNEFDLFRKSNYCLASGEFLYPIAQDEFIHSPEVTVFKDSSNLKLTPVFEIGVISMPPVHTPEIITIDKAETYASDETKEKMKNKIAAIFNFAESEGYDCLIIDNFGGGIFSNPICDLANMFNNQTAKCDIPLVAFSVYHKKGKKKDKEFMSYHRLINRNFD